MCAMARSSQAFHLIANTEIYMHTYTHTNVCVCVGPWDYSYGIRIGVNYIFNVTFHLILYFHTVCDFHFIFLFSSSTQTTRRKQQQNARERNRRPKSDGIQQHADSSIMGDEVSHFVLFSRDFFFRFSLLKTFLHSQRNLILWENVWIDPTTWIMTIFSSSNMENVTYQSMIIPECFVLHWG